MTSNDNNDKGPSCWLLVVLALIILCVLAAAWCIIPILYPRSEQAGQFGDMFGGITALFGGLAFAGVIYAILLQRIELKLQRQELKETRKELKGQKEQLEAQNKTFQKQAFENTFFQLLRLHNEMVRLIDMRKASGPIVGRDCFQVFYDTFKRYYDEILKKHPGETLINAIGKAYAKLYFHNRSDLSGYFRALYNIITFVESSDVVDKRLYFNTVRAQLSDYELLLLFYHCLSTVGRDHFKPLVEKYSLLKDLLTITLILVDLKHLVLFDRRAFGVEG